MSNINMFLIIILLLIIICYSIVFPIIINGLATYLYHAQEMNPLTKRVINKYNFIKFKILGKKWRKRTLIIDPTEIPDILWKEDILTSKGVDSFYILDSYADDVRSLLLPLWGLTFDKSLWFLSHFTNKYPWAKNTTQQVEHQIQKTNEKISIKTGNKLDTWIYLPAKVKQPTTYALDFDFVPHTSMQETLQICFATDSLAKRFRFVVRNNKTLHFEIIDKGFFLSEYFNDLTKPYSFELHKKYHITLKVIENIFSLYIDNNNVFAVRVDDYVPQDNYWNLIFWNGPKINQNMHIEIDNFKIMHKIY